MNLLTDDTTGSEIAAAAEIERATAFNATHHWRAAKLLWTSSREALYYILRVPPPPLSDEATEAVRAANDAKGTPEHAELLATAQRLIQASNAARGPDLSFYRNALIILWLASHTRKDWEPLGMDKAALMGAVEDWADQNIHHTELGDVVDATNKLLADAESTRAIPRPQGHASVEEGN